MKRAGRSLDRFSAKSKRSYTTLGLMADRLKLIAGTGIVFGAAYGFARLVANVERFNQAMQESMAIMHGLTDQMRTDMRRAALDLAKTVRYSGEEMARAFYYLTSAGLDTAQSLAALPAVARFAQAGMFDLARATEMLTDAQSALGMKMKDAGKNYFNMIKVSDALVRVTQLADATTEQFAQALANRAAAAMRMYKIPMEEGIAALAVFANQGIKAELAGRAFDIVLRDLAVKATENAQAFEEAGIAVFNLEGNFRAIPDIIADLERAYAGLSVTQIKQMQIMLGFPQRSIQFQNTLLGMSGLMQEYTDALIVAGGATQDVADNQLTDFTKAWERLKGVVMDTAETMQQTIDDTATSIQYLLDLLEGFPDKAEQARRKATGDKGWFDTARGTLLGSAAIMGPEALGGLSEVAAYVVALTDLNALSASLRRDDGGGVSPQDALLARPFIILRDELYGVSDAWQEFADEMTGFDTSAHRMSSTLYGMNDAIQQQPRAIGEASKSIAIWEQKVAKLKETFTTGGGRLPDLQRAAMETYEQFYGVPIKEWFRERARIEDVFAGGGGLQSFQKAGQRAWDRFGERTRQRQLNKAQSADFAALPRPTPEEIAASLADEEAAMKAAERRLKAMAVAAQNWATEIRTPFEVLIDALKRLKTVASEIDLSDFGNVKNLQRLRDMRRAEFGKAIGIEEAPRDIFNRQLKQLRDATRGGMFSADEEYKMRQQLTERFIEQMGGTRLEGLAEGWFKRTRQPDEIFVAKLEEIELLRTAGAFTEFAGSLAAGTELYQRAIGKATEEFAPKAGIPTRGLISGTQVGGMAGARVLSAASTAQAKELTEMKKQTKLLEQLLREQRAGGMRV